ncbi:hypothetical protein GF325_04185 [Candidatus Bathyarchaeota archaeon]|nr:hypothetical protein [Candidatus Bathyarchaeota archaeon]
MACRASPTEQTALFCVNCGQAAYITMREPTCYGCKEKKEVEDGNYH